MEAINKLQLNTELRANNKGISLVEVIIVMAISSIVLVMIGSFVSFGSRSYASANRESKLQMDSQVVLSQLEELLLESNQVINHELSADIRAIVLYYQNSTNVLIHDNRSNKLYYMDEILTEDATREKLGSLSYTDEMNLMAENVSDVMITKLQDKKDLVTISLTLTIGTNQRTFVKQITLRNKVAYNGLVDNKLIVNYKIGGKA